VKFVGLLISWAIPDTILEGTRRIKDIVADLRRFSRFDEAERKEVFLVEGLQSTLRLVKAQYYKDVEFICSFEVNPKLECMPGQLNQVFMNIIVNACQAIISRLGKGLQTSNSVPGKLVIQTFLKEKMAGIRFQDNGCGMSEKTRNSIFDPFFTTKPVGEGTGLGMSISFGIIEKHKGMITVDSKEGEGTIVELFLPC